MKLPKSLILFMLLMPAELLAEWQVVTHKNTDTDTSIDIAHIVNKDGYSLEIYQDTRGAVRLRFSMHKNIDRLDDKICPTFRIDKKRPRNNSINDAPCISNSQWAEFIPGYVIDNKIYSDILLDIIRGNNIYYSFRLSNSSYSETQFSLAGSKKALYSVLNENVNISADSN